MQITSEKKSHQCMRRINSIKTHDLSTTPPLSSVSASHQTLALIFDRQQHQRASPGSNTLIQRVIRKEDYSVRERQGMKWLVIGFPA